MTLSTSYSKYRER